MTISGRRIGAAALASATLTAAQLAGASTAQADIPTYKHCDLYNSGSDHLTAYCTKKAAGTEYRVVIRCSDGKVYRGVWRKQGGKYASSRYCPGGISITDGWRRLR